MPRTSCVEFRKEKVFRSRIEREITKVSDLYKQGMTTQEDKSKHCHNLSTIPNIYMYGLKTLQTILLHSYYKRVVVARIANKVKKEQKVASPTSILHTIGHATDRLRLGRCALVTVNAELGNIRRQTRAVADCKRLRRMAGATSLSWSFQSCLHCL